jgi:Calcineurin-like phosphoesterase
MTNDLYNMPSGHSLFDQGDGFVMGKHVVKAGVMALLVAVAFAATEARAAVLSRWVQLGPDGGVSVRAVTDGACPEVVFDGVAKTMAVRSQPQSKIDNVKPATFPVTGCEVAVPRGAVAATIAGAPLALPRPNPQRIVVLGDTGCRLLKGDRVQACNDPKAWPFPVVARSAAAAHPDLVIHVGDYLYRENPCPPDAAGCAGSPSGYGWDSWKADFFDPAAPLLAAAPWVFTRGNHEDCSRAGEGWFRFLDRAALPNTCRDLTGIFVARMGGFGIVVVDGAKAADPKADPAVMQGLLRDQFEAIRAKIPAEAWLVTHRPLDAMRAGDNGGPDVVENSIEEKALGPVVPKRVRMFVSGHIHFFQAVDFGGARPPQLVVGTGGDNLDPLPAMSVVGARINGKLVRKSAAHEGFAYMVWDRTGTSWLGTLFEVNGKPIGQCRLIGRSLGCDF